MTRNRNMPRRMAVPRLRAAHRQPARKRWALLATGGDDESLARRRRRCLVAGYRSASSAPIGYYYKILTRQGPNAPGGAIDYIARGKMIGGFALVAYPAEYKNSGVMTFLVNHQGVVYEKDLGPDTGAIASGMTTFDPDKTWQRVSDADQPGTGAR